MHHGFEEIYIALLKCIISFMATHVREDTSLEPCHKRAISECRRKTTFMQRLFSKNSSFHLYYHSNSYFLTSYMYLTDNEERCIKTINFLSIFQKIKC